MKISALVCALLLTVTPGVFSAEFPSEAQSTIYKLLAAIAAEDSLAFVSGGDEAFKTLSKKQFAAFSSQLAPLLNSDYQLTYLGTCSKMVTMYPYGS